MFRTGRLLQWPHHFEIYQCNKYLLFFNFTSPSTMLPCGSPIMCYVSGKVDGNSQNFTEINLLLFKVAQPFVFYFCYTYWKKLTWLPFWKEILIVIIKSSSKVIGGWQVNSNITKLETYVSHRISFCSWMKNSLFHKLVVGIS